jgi:hypothetical protein
MEFLQLIDIRDGLSFPLIKTSVQIRRAAARLVGARPSQFFESLRRGSPDHSRRPAGPVECRERNPSIWGR